MSDLGGAFTIEIIFGGGQPAKVHYDFDVTRGEVDLKHLMVTNAVTQEAKDLLGIVKLDVHLIAEIEQEVTYKHLNGST